MTVPLVFDGVTKRYGSHTAVADVTAEIGSGERVALLGRNGAGKSTLLQVALGLIRPSEGVSQLFGQDPQGHRARSGVGYVPQANSVPDRLRVREVIRFVRDVKGVAEPAELIERLQLGPMLHRLCGVLSEGQKRRLTVLLALLGEPELVVLDEPTASLDTQSRSTVWELVQEFCGAGGTLLLASHDFREVSILTERVFVLAGGRVRADSDVPELAASTGFTALEMPRITEVPSVDASFVIHTADRTIMITRASAAVLEQLGPAPGGHVLQREPTVEEICLAIGRGTR